jgi:uncharacterized protein
MKLSREKVMHMSHLILNYLNNDEEIEFYADPQEIRTQIFQMISDEMRADEAIDALVRRKLESQKKYQEGSDDWDVMYRKYYEEEAAKHRKVMP